MASVGNLVANLTMNTKGFSAGASRAKSTMATMSSTIRAGVGSIAASLAPVAGLFAGAFAVRNSLASARTQIQAEQKLAAVIKATGGAAQLSAQQIGQLASERQAVTNFGDEATIAAASVLATFKEIKGDTFKTAIVAMQDMSTVMGQDLNSSAVQLGKALNDPILGISALSRVGVSFTEQQKEQIRAMQEAGNIAGAQQIILAELKSEFGGAAEAIADPWTQLKNTVGDLAENLGYLLLPAINSISTQLNGMIGVASGAVNTFKEFGAIGGVIFANLGEVGQLAWVRIQLGVVQLTSAMHHLFTAQLPALFEWFGRNWKDLFFTAFDLATTVFINLGTNIRNVMGQIWEFISSGGTKELSLAWTPLTDGFVNTIKEIPNLPDRPIGELEQRLIADTERITTSLADKMATAISEVNATPEVKTAIEAADTEAQAGAAKQSTANAAVAFGSREALSAAARIANASKDPAVKATEKVEKAVKELPEKLAEVVPAFAGGEFALVSF